MARGGRGGGHGGRSHGFGHHHHGFGGIHHHHHSFGRSRGGGGGISLEATLDMITANTTPAILMNGIYSFAGSEMAFRSQSTAIITPVQMMPMVPMAGTEMGVMSDQASMGSYGQSPMLPNMIGVGMVPPNPNAPMQQANLTIVGAKTKAGSQCCIISTIMAGACCIFPLCFMCCAWWKQIAYPLYELSADAYRAIGEFVQKNPTLNNLNLSVADNAFNAEKARILLDILSRGQITGFNFVNMALACNGKFNELDDFRNNVAPIKSLPIGTSLTWGDNIA